jgi:uncharacterized membrane protein YtjA (UPF0391 family)
MDFSAWNRPARERRDRKIPGHGAVRTAPAAGNFVKIPKLSEQNGRPGVEDLMTLLKWALLFFVISVVAGILGFTGVSAASADIARFLFYVFVVIFLVLLILGLTIFRV